MDTIIQNSTQVLAQILYYAFIILTIVCHYEHLTSSSVNAFVLFWLFLFSSFFPFVSKTKGQLKLTERPIVIFSQT